MPQIVSSAGVYTWVESVGVTDEEVWYADVRVCFIEEGKEASLACIAVGIDAVAIERRERTRSRGYVVQTDVIPANAPLASRFGVSSSFDPNFVNHCIPISANVPGNQKPLTFFNCS